MSCILNSNMVQSSSYLGTVIVSVMCMLVNGYVHSMSVYTPFTKDEITITINGISIQHIGNVPLDYKGIQWVGDHYFTLYSSAPNANGNDLLNNQLAVLHMTITKN